MRILGRILVIATIMLTWAAGAQALDCTSCHTDAETLFTAGQALGKTLSKEQV